MKKIVFGTFVLGSLLFASCSEKEGGQEEPLQPAGAEEQPVEVKAYTDVEPLEALRWWNPSADEKKGLEALADFAYKLNGAVVDGYSSLWPTDATGNYTVSPVSISVFISALSQSVDSEASEDLCKMLGLSRQDAADLNNKLLRHLSQNEENMQLSIANSVWHVESMPILEEYAARMARQFGAPVNVLDLYASESVDVLNGWCGDKTHGMIKDIFKDAPKVDFVLANALYFSSSWMYDFSEKCTENSNFTGTDGKVDVEMMHHPSLPTNYAKVDGTEFIILPFGSNFEMDIIMPATGTDMDDFGKSLDAKGLAALESASKYVEVDFRLPKFSDAHQADVKDILTALGYPQYDLPTREMTGCAGFPLRFSGSKATHATALNVNEKGAELAAVTFGGWATSTGEEPEYEKVEMTVDRPFYYVVRNTNCAAVLMVGRVCNL